VEEPESAPSLRTILDQYEWHKRAACYSEPDPRTFFPETNYKTSGWAPRELLPLLICQGCPVREDVSPGGVQLVGVRSRRSRARDPDNDGTTLPRTPWQQAESAPWKHRGEGDLGRDNGYGADRGRPVLDPVRDRETMRSVESRWRTKPRDARTTL